MVKVEPIYRVFQKLSTYSRPITDYVNASSNSVLNDNSLPNNVLVSSDKNYHSSEMSGAYLRFEFLKSPIYIEFIKLQTAKNQDPTNWRIEGTDINGKTVELYRNDQVVPWANVIVTIMRIERLK